MLAAPYVRPARAAQRLRLAIAHTRSDHFGLAATALADTLREGSDGRIRVEIFTDSALGAEETTLAGVRAGTLDLTIVASGLVGAYAPEVGLFDMPFLFRDSGHARAVLDGPVGRDYLAAAAAKGVPVLGWAENGIRNLTANRPVRSVADLKGLRLRAMPAPLLLDCFRIMGADASPLSFPLVYEALRVGEFDAQENPVALVIASRFYEVQSHLMLTRHTYSASAVVVSPDVLDDLPAADRELFHIAARAAVETSRAFVSESDRTGPDWLRGHGMTVITDVDRDSFRQAAAPAEAAVAQRFGAGRIAELRAGA